MILLRNPIAMLLFGAFLISLSGVWVKTAQVPASLSAFYRVFLGGMMLMLLAAVRGELQQVSGRNVRMAILAGVIFTFDLFLFHLSILRVGPGLGTILLNFQVFILAAIGIMFLGERLGITYLLSIASAVTGLFMIVGFDWSVLPSEYVDGILCGLGGAVMYALYLLALRKTQSLAQGVSPLLTMAMISLVAAAMLALEALRHGQLFMLPDLQGVLSLAVLALFSQVVGWSCIASSLPHVRASLAGMILLLQPALAFVWDWLFFHRTTTTVNWLGLCIVLGAIYVGSMRATDPAANKAQQMAPPLPDKGCP